MNRYTSVVSILLAVSTLSFCACGAETPPALPGANPSVKDWGTPKYESACESAKNSCRPTCLYVYGGSKKAQSAATAIEVTFLDNAEVKKVLGKLACIKVDYSPPYVKGADAEATKRKQETAKSWPEGLIDPAKALHYAVLLLDENMQVVATYSGATALPNTFVAKVKTLLEVSDKKKVVRQSAQKAKEAADAKKEADAVADQKVAGNLLGIGDKDKDGNPKQAAAPKQPVKPAAPIDE